MERKLTVVDLPNDALCKMNYRMFNISYKSLVIKREQKTSLLVKQEILWMRQSLWIGTN
jgi:hypothetical protein